MLRLKLSQAEGELEDRCWAAPQGLQAWLQLTHELENKAHQKKRLNAEKQLSQARDAVWFFFLLLLIHIIFYIITKYYQ